MPSMITGEELLSRIREALPTKPAVASMEVLPYVNWMGDEALEVVIHLVATDVDESDVDGLVDISDRAREAARAAEPALFPYVRFEHAPRRRRAQRA